MPVVQRQVGHIRPYGAYGRRVTRHPGSPPTRALLSKKKKPEHQRFHQGRAGGAQMFMSCVLLSSPTTRRYNNVLISIRLPYQDRLTVCVLRESSFDLSFSGAATVPSSCWAGPGRAGPVVAWVLLARTTQHQRSRSRSTAADEYVLRRWEIGESKIPIAYCTC